MKLNKKFTTKQRREFYEGLVQMIGDLLNTSPLNDDDKLHIAVLAELQLPLQKKLLIYQQQYTHSFTPAQAFALRILYNGYYNDPKTYMGNLLHGISNQIHQTYNA